MNWIDAPVLSGEPLLGFHPLLAQALLRRGLSGMDAAAAFLDPDRYHPAPATDLPGIEMAVERIAAALHARECICIWGDFDVDGQTATCLLVQSLRALGGNVIHHIPVRSREGHGVNQPFLEEVIRKRGASLVITCDTGITAHEAALQARRLGAEMIITDHHELPVRIPEARAVIDPRMLPREHPLASLSGVGVAHKLCEALATHLGRASGLPDTLDLVALGLVADLAELRGDSRYLVQKGIRSLRTTSRVGLHALYDRVDLQPEQIIETHIGYTLAPRMNALGRLGDANPIVDFLTTEDLVRARVMATQLENYNAQRRLLTSQVTQAVEAQLRADPSLLASPVIILHHPSWLAGVTGIAAAQVVSRYGKPAILLSSPAGEPARGSARSVEGIDITKVLAGQSDLLIAFGGHPMAAGLSILPENIPAFCVRMAWAIDRIQASRPSMVPTMEIDAWLPLADLTLDLADELEKLAPYGPGNPRLIFACRGLEVVKVIQVGRNNEHRKITMQDADGNRAQVIWWDGGLEEPPTGRFDLAFTLRASDWQGTRQVQLEWIDYRPTKGEEIKTGKKEIQVVDHRQDEDLEELIRVARARSSAIIWAEGEALERIGGRDRNELGPSELLVIWSIPPSGEELHTALKKVDPQEIWLVGADPEIEATENFLARIAGLVKYSLAHREGKVSYPQLAAATGHRLVTVHKAIAWMVAKGLIGVFQQEGDDLILSSQTVVNDPPGAASLWRETQSLLAETAAYRAHFKRAGKDTLITLELVK